MGSPTRFALGMTSGANVATSIPVLFLQLIFTFKVCTMYLSWEDGLSEFQHLRLKLWSKPRETIEEFCARQEHAASNSASDVLICQTKIWLRKERVVVNACEHIPNVLNPRRFYFLSWQCTMHLGDAKIILPIWRWQGKV